MFIHASLFLVAVFDVLVDLVVIPSKLLINPLKFSLVIPQIYLATSPRFVGLGSHFGGAFFHGLYFLEYIVKLDAYFLLLSAQVTVNVFPMNWILRNPRILSHASLFFRIILFDLLSTGLTMESFNLVVLVLMHQFFQNCSLLNCHVSDFGLLLACCFVSINLLCEYIIGHLFFRLFGLS